MRPALALLALAVPAACFVAPQRRLAARPLFAEEKADFDPNAKVSQLDEVLIQWGIKDDPRIPEECRVDPMTRIKEAGKAGVAAYTLTEFAFWLGSVPLAIALVAYTTGSLPDFATTEGKEAVAGYVFVFINFFCDWIKFLVQNKVVVHKRASLLFFSFFFSTEVHHFCVSAHPPKRARLTAISTTRYTRERFFKKMKF